MITYIDTRSHDYRAAYRLARWHMRAGMNQADTGAWLPNGRAGYNAAWSDANVR